MDPKASPQETYMSRSTLSSLKETLNECLPLGEKNISEKHLMAAQELLSLDSNCKTATTVLNEVAHNSKYSSSLQNVAANILTVISSKENIESLVNPEVISDNCEPDGKGGQNCTPPEKS